MAETERITVAETSDGQGGAGEAGRPVSLPVVELLTGRGFVTGKSGSGKSNTASVIAEKLLDNGFGLLIVDIDGEYYGLKEEYEILHAGADEECDIRITPDHAERLATLALEENVPIILDVSSFLDESKAESVLTAVARQLFVKAKKQKQPFLMLVEEVHEYIPEGGSVGECGKMLIKIGKRGRKHGLGIVGISQRPADVKKDFITQCDWLVWHRLTWDNDTKVVKRVLDGEYATAVEGLDDGEGFLMTDWAETIRRVQFQRKRTFDAGATPGLEDFERPDLKSVSEDLVSELESIGDEDDDDDRITQLREKLDEKNSRIAELERELRDARDLSRMADQFVEALTEEVRGENPGRTEKQRLRERRHPSGAGTGASDEGTPDTSERDGTESRAGDRSTEKSVPEGETGSFSAEEVLSRLSAVVDAPGGVASADGGTTVDATTDTDPTAPGTDGDGTDWPAGAWVGGNGDDWGGADGDGDGDRSANASEAGDGEQGEIIDAAGPPTARNGIEGNGGPPETAAIIDGEDKDREDGGSVGDRPLAVRELTALVDGLETRTRRMLACYAERGPTTPLVAHEAAGGDGDRTSAYAHNRRLRTAGLIEHVGRGRYECRLGERLREAIGDGAGEHVDRITRRALDPQSDRA